MWEKDGLFNTWGRHNWPVHLEENKARPYTLYTQINLRCIKHLSDKNKIINILLESLGKYT